MDGLSIAQRDSSRADSSEGLKEDLFLERACGLQAHFVPSSGSKSQGYRIAGPPRRRRGSARRAALGAGGRKEAWISWGGLLLLPDRSREVLVDAGVAG